MDKIETMYSKFRQELDAMWVPVLLKDNELKVVPITYEGNLVGMLCTFPGYIDCVYVTPEYRHKGLAKKVVCEYVEKHFTEHLRLHIINNNEVAKTFWNSLFKLVVLDTNSIDTLYEIVDYKYR